jgi:hypothetical protein
LVKDHFQARSRVEELPSDLRLLCVKIVLDLDYRNVAHYVDPFPEKIELLILKNDGSRPRHQPQGQSLK